MPQAGVCVMIVSIFFPVVSLTAVLLETPGHLQCRIEHPIA